MLKVGMLFAPGVSLKRVQEFRERGIEIIEFPTEDSREVVCLNQALDRAVERSVGLLFLAELGAEQMQAITAAADRERAVAAFHIGDSLFAVRPREFLFMNDLSGRTLPLRIGEDKLSDPSLYRAMVLPSF